MTVKYTKGSLLPFVAIGVVLVIALAAVLYAVRQRSEQAKIAAQPSVQVTPPASTESPSPETSTPSTSQPEQSTTHTPQNQPTNNNSGSSTSGGSAPGSLPQTGPQDTLVSLAVVAALAYVLSSYVQSRRQLERLF